MNSLQRIIVPVLLAVSNLTEVFGNCLTSQFACDDGTCIPFKYHCDGLRHCSDNSDEAKCKCTTEDRTFSTGVIASPLYPLLETTPQCKWWNIKGEENDVITISFTDLDLPNFEGQNCTSNYVEIGPKPHAIFCGSQLDGKPRTYISEKSKVFIKYQYKGDLPGRGFQLDYIRGPVSAAHTCRPDEATCNNGKCILRKWRCNGAYECGDTINSDEQRCTNISRLTTPGPYNCGSDKFGCVDVITNTYTCFPAHMRCDGYRQCADSYDESHGCHVQQSTTPDPSHCAHGQFGCEAADTGQFQCFPNTKWCDGDSQCAYGMDENDCGLCSYNFNGGKGTLTSPNFPHNYPDNAACTYYISVGSGDTVQLRFYTFSLEEKENTDSVKVYDGDGTEDELLGYFYHSHPPPRVITSTGDQMFIVFHSNSAVTRMGFNATFQTKGECIADSQFACLLEENDCYDREHKCDGVWDCPQFGGDEWGCPPCKTSKDYPCGSKSSQCFTFADRCNGKSHCAERTDEIDCLTYQCGPHNGTFLCRNRQCVLESWVCDGANDCGDNSDEIRCPLSTKVIIAAVIGSLTCSLLLVVALGCTCKLHALRLREQAGISSSSSSSRYISPLTQVQEEIFARRSAPPPYLEAMRTSRNFDEVQREVMSARQAALDAASTESRSRSRGQSQRSEEEDPGGVPSVDSSDDDDDDLIDISMDTGQNGEREEDFDASNVQISLAMGVSAQWRRARGRPKSEHRSRSQRETQSQNTPALNASTHSDTIEILSDTASASNESVIISVDIEDNKQTDPSETTGPADTELLGEHSSSQTVANNRRLSYDPGEEDGSDVESVDSDSVTMETTAAVEHHTAAMETDSLDIPVDVDDSILLL